MLISNPVHPPQVPPVGWRHYREHAFFGQAGTFSPRQLTFTGQSRRTCPPSRSPSSPVRPSSRTRSSAPRRTTTLGARARMPSRLRRSGLALVVVPRSRSRLILSSPFFFLSFFSPFFLCHLSVKQVIKTLHTNAHLSKTVAQSILASVHEAVSSGKVLTQAKGCSASLPLSLSCSSSFMKKLTLARAHVFQ